MSDASRQSFPSSSRSRAPSATPRFEESSIVACHPEAAGAIDARRTRSATARGAKTRRFSERSTSSTISPLGEAGFGTGRPRPLERREPARPLVGARRRPSEHAERHDDGVNSPPSHANCKRYQRRIIRRKSSSGFCSPGCSARRLPRLSTSGSRAEGVSSCGRTTSAAGYPHGRERSSRGRRSISSDRFRTATFLQDPELARRGGSRRRRCLKHRNLRPCSSTSAHGRTTPRPGCTSPHGVTTAGVVRSAARRSRRSGARCSCSQYEGCAPPSTPASTGVQRPKPCSG